MAFTAKQKLAAADREVMQRMRVYPRLIRDGKMSRREADFQTDIMRAIAEDYHVIVLREEHKS